MPYISLPLVPPPIAPSLSYLGAGHAAGEVGAGVAVGDVGDELEAELTGVQHATKGCVVLAAFLKGRLNLCEDGWRRE